MVNPNRWSWSAGPRRSSIRGDAVSSSQPLARSPDKPISCEVDVPNDQNLQGGGATSVSSRRLTKNRWSWRPDAAISVTLEDQPETTQGERQDREQNSEQVDTSASKSRRLSKLIKKTNTAPISASRPKRRPTSMIAPTSSSFGASPSYSHPASQAVQQHIAVEEDQDHSSRASPLPNQPATGVKNKLNRFLSRHITTRQVDKRAVLVQHQHQQTQGDPTPPPSGLQQEKQRPMPMQPPMRHRLQLHNPQNTLRASPAPPVAHIQTQGYTDNGRLVAPLPGLDENSQLQLPPATSRPATVTGPVPAAAQSLGTGTSPSMTAAPPADETGLLNRLMRRRLVSKDKDAQNKKTSISAGNDHTSSSQSLDQQRVTEQRETQTGPLLMNPLMLNPSHPTPAESETVLDARRGSLKSAVPRFLRPVTLAQQAPTNATQTAGAANSPKPKSPPRQQSTMQTSSSDTATQLKSRSKASFGKRFWSRSGANDFGEDNVTSTETPATASAPRTAYVPKHAAADFSRTTFTNTSRHNRHSFSFGSDPDNGAQALATITAASSRVNELEQPLHRQRTPSAETAEKRRSRDMSLSKYEAPPPHELHRRLEIVKSSEIEVVTTREPVAIDPLQQQQHSLLQNASNTSSANGKAPARPHSRPLSSQRHSFNLVSDPYARDLTPPKSISPVEMEAPFDPPSQPEQQQAPPSAPPRPTSSHTRPPSRQETPSQESGSREPTDYERFVAEAEIAEREYHAQMWRNLARRSGHYGYSDNPWSTTRQADATAPAGQRNNKRSSAQYSTGAGKRASMMSFGAADDERNLISSSFYGEAPRKPSLSHSASVGADGKRGLRHQGSVSKRISDYIKPPKPSQQATYEDWPSGRANRRSVIAGISEY
ncbi:uncharacterized protein CCOS01_10314 [Colletotrichum costaricense]|uniref:Uncharacterized protein n=1 Tax=Colletotrichum costaricense TaxID=1209916 RepID=A0AAI9YUB1_9PEZI|nr:uncharacterized protein CCOS01_10314 [Colletotrichum costaricense]KAK1522602.1 hypothetical protein CCOS01_10314 [Colletotrichum costaricense]